MSAAEREEKLARMRADAESHEEDRRKRAKVDEARSRHEEEAAEAERMRRGGGANEEEPSFVRDLAQKVYSEEDGVSLPNACGAALHAEARARKGSSGAVECAGPLRGCASSASGTHPAGVCRSHETRKVILPN